MTRRDVPGTTYLLHLDPPYKHARHYVGFAEGDALDARLADHGGPHGARLLAAQKAAGGTWYLTRTWPGTTRAFERRVKDTRAVPHYCPDCQPARSATRRAARQARKDTDAMTTETNPPAPPRLYAPEGTPPGTDPYRDYQSKLQARHVESLTSRERAAAKAGFGDATRTVTAQYAAGLGLDAIAAHHDDVSASLLADAQTGYGRAYAREYGDTARTLVADLRQDQAVAQGRSAAACTLPQGTPHPDPVLAARGWQVDRGVYQRTGQALRQAETDREAG
jgi:hypothetical protein